jgi:hypothetical protein
MRVKEKLPYSRVSPYSVPSTMKADVVCVAVDQGDAYAVAENHLEVLDEVGPDKVAGAGEAVADGAGRRRCVVDVYAECLLRAGHIEEGHEVVGRRGVVVGVANVVDTTTAESVVGFFDERTAQVGGLRAGELAVFGAAVGFAAVFDLVMATFGHIVGLLHEGVDGVVNRLYAIGVVDGELGVIRGLDA